MNDDDDFVFPDGIDLNTTLGEAREWLFDRIVKGAKCPCCERTAKMYKRPLYGAMARAMIDLWNEHAAHPDAEWIHMPRISKGGDEAKARFWGLIEPQPDVVRADGSTRTGWWRLTALGRRFLRGEVTVTKRVKLYGAKFYGFVDGDPQIGITDIMGDSFNYDKLMRGEL